MSVYYDKVSAYYVPQLDSHQPNIGFKSLLAREVFVMLEGILLVVYVKSKFHVCDSWAWRSFSGAWKLIRVYVEFKLSNVSGIRYLQYVQFHIRTFLQKKLYPYAYFIQHLAALSSMLTYSTMYRENKLISTHT